MPRTKGAINRPKHVIAAEKIAKLEKKGLPVPDDLRALAGQGQAKAEAPTNPGKKRGRKATPLNLEKKREKVVPDPIEPVPDSPATVARKAKGKKARAEWDQAAEDSTNGATPLVRVPVENGKRYTLSLPVPASPTEIGIAAVEMTRQIDAQAALLIERREAMAEFKERLSGIHDRLNELSEGVKNGTKKVDVEVTEQLVVETHEIQVVRLDDGTIVSTRAAEGADVQETLFPDADAPTSTPATRFDELGEEARGAAVSEAEPTVELEDDAFDPSEGLAAEPDTELVPDIEATPDLLAAAEAAAEAEIDEGV
jgi:hypothetical protein